MNILTLDDTCALSLHLASLFLNTVHVSSRPNAQLLTVAAHTDLTLMIMADFLAAHRSPETTTTTP